MVSQTLHHVLSRLNASLESKRYLDFLIRFCSLGSGFTTFFLCAVFIVRPLPGVGGEGGHLFSLIFLFDVGFRSFMILYLLSEPVAG